LSFKKRVFKEKISNFDRHISKILIFSQDLGSKQPVFNFHKVQKSDRRSFELQGKKEAIFLQLLCSKINLCTIRKA